jgi:peptidoglycan/LPS O-acetylase OafA/YrhL
VNKSIPLQSLRGIAVSLVVLYHMGFTSFHNGWIGVDLFFVISGFLMWELYRNSILRGDIKDFYARRFRRLLPALSILLVFSSVLFFVIFLPHERRIFANEVLSANFFGSNIHYWMGDQYFSNGSLRPLLNLWSISLEIQFYLLFPLIVFFIKASKARFLFLMLLSFLSFLVLSVVSPQTNFFLLPGRLWEFMMGIAVGIVIRRRFAYKPNFTLTLVFGIVLLVTSLGVSLDRVETVVFQVTSVFLFSILIWVGWSSHEKNILLNALGKLGDYSYSVYLIHFPLIVAVGYTPFLGNPNGVESERGLLIFLSTLFLLSLASRRFVEESRFARRNFLKIWGVSLSLSVIMLGLQPVISSIGYSKEELVVSNASRDRGDFRCGFVLRLPFLNDPAKTCLLADSPENLGRVLLVGDSHANAIKEAVVEALPMKSVYLLNENNALSSFNLRVYKSAVVNLRPEIVIIHSSAGHNSRFSLGPFVKFARDQNIRILVIDPVPIPGFDVPTRAFALLNQKEFLMSFSDENFRLESYLANNEAELKFLSQLATAGEIDRISVADLFCNPYCQIVDRQTLRPLYFDYGHLTKTGASRLLPRIAAAIE